ncbi:MAG: hypothetical protein J2P13_06355 [Acidobacteria bacterium]|nr:hypothetical protein [Acidobacteriota bacterium]
MMKKLQLASPVPGVYATSVSLESKRGVKWRRSLGPAAVSVCLVLICVWPALYNGQPLFYADTSTYIRGADAGFSRLTHRVTVWSGQDISPGDAKARADSPPRRKSINSVADKEVFAGRSIYYGGLLYLGDITGRLWPAVFVQAAVVLLAIALTLKTFSTFTWLRFFAISLVLAMLTPMAFFASYLMPDVFAAITILASASLLTLRADTPSWETVTWIGLLSAALLFHDSHIVIALVLLLLAVLWAVLSRRPIPWTGVGAIAVALALAFAGEALFSLGVTKLVGAPPLRIPFLMARMIADGPGYRYLVRNCPGSQLTICQFLDRLPHADSEGFLWSTEPARGVFAVSDPKTRRKLADEQFRFVGATFAFDPFGELASVLEDTWSQLYQFDLEEFNFSSAQRDFLAAHVPEPYLGQMKTTRAWKGAMPTRALSRTMMILAVLSSACLIATIVRRKRLGYSRRSMIFAAAVVAGVITNAAVCGAMSRTLNRYQARVVWVLPLTAILLPPFSFRPQAPEHD